MITYTVPPEEHNNMLTLLTKPYPCPLLEPEKSYWLVRVTKVEGDITMKFEKEAA